MNTPIRSPSHQPLPQTPLAAAAGDAAIAARLVSAGADVVIAYHSSPLRRQGLPSVAGLLPWGNANDTTLRILPEIIAAAPGGPVFATVCANDAQHPAAAMLTEVAALGAHGILNAPTVGLLTGPVRRALEAAGLGYQREIEIMASARARGLRAWGYAFTPQQAQALAQAGAEAVIVHLGITTPGSVTSRTRRLMTAVADAACGVSPQIRVLAHGGPLTTPAAFSALRRDHPQVPAVSYGFFGASVFDHASDLCQAVREWRTAVDHQHPAPSAGRM
jgi:predicted TIM-barrel enzyme